ncbi:hypothetical protein ASPWEDRAFT_36579 [Aspergillus wentii DTO 134E9]|uniref:Uncharacterized protein n=1 Tax=Aspergillus wentii DTO 134E9 TaxID=1073089 RepID=A0A1L9RVE5_ASPWE|nr:uncharacterized protein ASPWEDRAFT_36579 [Aspergillus wentii DTO 134E9]KAI9928793.1 hypothetical protein MW887_002011 [Aspergillus wentii]OJJ38892.1 hypothetical protein ASPWEDRAFT_36579 [Aspergillus wentii DTO 134E9]
MQFWVGWALWQKLSTVLAFLITLVLIYSFSILLYNRRMTRKHAAAEAYQKEEQDAELRPMLTVGSDIPFGARALERGVQVEGIWISSDNNTPLPTPQKPGTPIGTRPSSSSVSTRLDSVPENVPRAQSKTSLAYPVASHINRPDPRCTSRARDDNVASDSKSSSFYSESVVESQHAHPAPLKNDEPYTPNEGDVPQSKNKSSVRSSWIGKSPDKYKRRSIIGGKKPEGFTMLGEKKLIINPPGNHARRSSEEFRRRISRLIDENIQTRPSETFQLNPFRRAAEESHKRKSKLGASQP